MEYRAIITHGLPRHGGPPARVLVLGAGMAGLVAAYELLRAGHDPLVLEARGRVGGRIFTMREPFAPGLYGEAGAMRIPRAHDLTMAYVEQFGLPTIRFPMHNPRAYYHVGGRRFRIADVEADPTMLPFDLAEGERGKTIGELCEALVAPLRRRIEDEGEAAWAEIVAAYDGHSIREHLEASGWSEGAIEMFGVLANIEALMNTSFLELLREEIGCYFTDTVTIPGGMDRLPQSFLPALAGRIRFGAKVIALDQSPDEVTVHYQTPAGRSRVSAEYAVMTLPFPVLRHIEILQPFSRPKQRAIRQLHYDPSSKIFLQCRRRFWEEDDGILGGRSMTDLAIRKMYYPPFGHETGRGVLLASYAWGEDAERWASLDPEDRIEQAVENVARIHPQAASEVEVGASYVWHEDEFAGGAFALFEPGQQTLLQTHITAPEGRIHFAGEHTSLAHAWIQGAIESGLRAAAEIHERATAGTAVAP